MLTAYPLVPFKPNSQHQQPTRSASYLLLPPVQLLLPLLLLPSLPPALQLLPA
jgi:hypothetical protein